MHKDERLVSLLEALERELEFRNWEQVDLAKAAGLGKQTINYLFRRAKGLPDPDTLQALAQGLARRIPTGPQVDPVGRWTVWLMEQSQLLSPLDQGDRDMINLILHTVPDRDRFARMLYQLGPEGVAEMIHFGEGYLARAAQQQSAATPAADRPKTQRGRRGLGN